MRIKNTTMHIVKGLEGSAHMLKKTFLVLMAIVLAVTALPVAFAGGEPRIIVTSATAMPGETVTLSVKLENNPGINSFSLGFNYDKERLELKNVTVSPKLGGQFAYKTRAVWIRSDDTKYNGEILSLTFKVRDKAKNGAAAVSVNYLQGEISNYNEDDVNFSPVAGKIEVGISQSLMRDIFELMGRIFSLLRRLFGV